MTHRDAAPPLGGPLVRSVQAASLHQENQEVGPVLSQEWRSHLDIGRDLVADGPHDVLLMDRPGTLTQRSRLLPFMHPVTLSR